MFNSFDQHCIEGGIAGTGRGSTLSETTQSDARYAGVTEVGTPFFSSGADPRDEPPEDPYIATRPLLNQEDQASAMAEVYGHGYVADLSSSFDWSTAQVQRKASSADDDVGDIQSIAAQGVQGSGGTLPYLDEIQESFGAHDVSGVRAHVGGRAADAAGEIGALAYATGNDVAFAQSPDLHTASHEAAHVVQQRSGVQLLGGVGQVGDSYEQQADAVADLVVQGKSAAHLFGPAMALNSAPDYGVQKKESPRLTPTQIVGSIGQGPAPKSEGDDIFKRPLCETDANAGTCFLTLRDRDTVLRRLGERANRIVGFFQLAVGEVQMESMLKKDPDAIMAIAGIFFSVAMGPIAGNLAKLAKRLPGLKDVLGSTTARKGINRIGTSRIGVTPPAPQLGSADFAPPTLLGALQNVGANKLVGPMKAKALGALKSSFGRKSDPRATGGAEDSGQLGDYLTNLKTQAGRWGQWIIEDAPKQLDDVGLVQLTVMFDSPKHSVAAFKTKIAQLVSKHKSQVGVIKKNAYEAVRFASNGQTRLAICTDAGGLAGSGYVFREWVDGGLIASAEKQQIIADGDIIEIDLQAPSYDFVSPSSPAFNDWVKATGAEPQEPGKSYRANKKTGYEKLPGRLDRRRRIYNRLAKERFKRFGGHVSDVGW